MRSSRTLAYVPEQASANQSGVSSPESQPGAGLSQVIGSVLGQLSLSAWLPAAMFVGVGSLLAEIHGEARLDVGAAMVRLTRAPLGIVVVLLFALVLTTMITQAFSYEAIRFLEGYWGTSRLAVRLAGDRIACHQRRRARLEESEGCLRRDAFAAARQTMIANGVSQKLVDILELLVNGQSAEKFPQRKVREAMSMGWRGSAGAWELRRLDATSARLAQYPEPYRILPTRLGNLLRATEDELQLADGGDLKGFVLRNYSHIPSPLLSQHAQFRTRLDMYCTLVFVFAALALASLVALWSFGPAHFPALVASAVFGVLADLSYRAGVSSASGYCTALGAIDSGVTASLSSRTGKVRAS